MCELLNATSVDADEVNESLKRFECRVGLERLGQRVQLANHVKTALHSEYMDSWMLE